MRLAHAAAWLTLGQAIRAASALALPVILVRAITQGDYGLYKQLDLASALLTPLIIIGFDKSVTYFVPRKTGPAQREISTPISAMLGLSVLALAIALVAPGVFGTVFGSAPMTLLVAATAVYATSGAITQIASRALVAVGLARRAGLLAAIIGVPRAAVLILVAVLFPRLAVILWTTLSLAAAQTLLVVCVLAREGIFRVEFHRGTFVRHFRYSGVLGLTGVLQAWSTRIDRYLISSGLTPEAFAVYAVGRTNVPLIPILPSALADASAPRYSELESRGLHREMATLWRKSVEVILPFSLLVACFLAATAQWSIPIVFTDAYAGAVPVFRVHAFTFLLQALLGIELILRALAAMRFLVMTVIASLVLRIVLGLLVLGTGNLALQAGVQLAVGVAVVGARVLVARNRLGVGWNDLLPMRALALPAALAVAGLVVTLTISATLGERRVIALGVSAVAWGALGAIVLWRQDLWRRLLPARVRGGSGIDSGG